MEIVKIPIVDFFKHSLDSAYHYGFTWVMCLLARDADAEELYVQIKKYWDSFHDITGNTILFVFAGKCSEEKQSNSLLRHETECYRALTNPSLKFVGDDVPTVPAQLYPDFEYDTYQINEVAVTHSRSITELRKFFCLSEKDVPSLVFVPTDNFVRQNKIVVHLNGNNLYQMLKRIMESLEEPLEKLKKAQDNYAYIKKRQTEINDEIFDLQKGTNIQNRFVKAKSYLESLIRDTNDDLVKKRLNEAICNKSVNDWHQYDRQTRTYLNQYLDFIKLHPALENEYKPTVSRIVSLNAERKQLSIIEIETSDNLKTLHLELARMIRGSKSIGGNVSMNNINLKPILLVTANKNETFALLEDKDFFRYTSGNRSSIPEDTLFYNIGYFGQYYVVHFELPEQGSARTDASFPSVETAIRAYNPIAVILVGIAFGKDYGEEGADYQQIGDVLVSTLMTDYESCKVQNGEIHSDSVTADAGRHLKSAFQYKATTWGHRINKKIARCEFGEVLSGDKVINDKEFKIKLFNYYPRAIGGEMEGRGAYFACRRHNINEWIIVKAICDWADGNKSKDKQKHQLIAARSAVSLLKHIFSDGKVFDKIIPKCNKTVNSLVSEKMQSKNDAAIVDLLNKAEKAKFRDSFPEALSILDNAFKIINENDDVDEMSILCVNIAYSNILTLSHNPDKALEYADKALNMSAIEKKQVYKYRALIVKAQAAGFTGNLIALRTCVHALSDLDYNDKNNEGILLEIKSNLCFMEGDVEKAIELLKEGADIILGKLADCHDEERNIILHQRYANFEAKIGMIEKHKGRFIEAAKRFLDAYNFLATVPLPLEQIKYFMNYIKCRMILGEWEAAFLELDNALTLSKQHDDIYSVVQCLEWKASIVFTYWDGEKHYIGIDFLKEALDITKDIYEKIHLHRLLACVFEKNHKYVECQKHLNNAFELANQTDDTQLINSAQHQKEQFQSEMSKLAFFQPKESVSEEASQEVIDALLKEIYTCVTPHEKAYKMFQLGTAYFSKSDTANAAKWFLPAIELAKKVSDIPLAATVLTYYAGVVMSSDDPTGDDESKRLIDETIELVKDMPLWEVKSRCELMLGRYEARQGNYEQALPYFNNAKSILHTHSLQIKPLMDAIERQLDALDDMFFLRKATSIDFEELINELTWLEEWYPEYRNKLRRLWWYNRYEDIMRNLLISKTSKALIMSNTAQEVDRLSESLEALFETTTFYTNSSAWIANENNRSCMVSVPVPETLPLPYVNVFCVLDIPPDCPRPLPEGPPVPEGCSAYLVNKDGEVHDYETK